MNVSVVNPILSSLQSYQEAGTTVLYLQMRKLKPEGEQVDQQDLRIVQAWLDHCGGGTPVLFSDTGNPKPKHL